VEVSSLMLIKIHYKNKPKKKNNQTNKQTNTVILNVPQSPTILIAFLNPSGSIAAAVGDSSFVHFRESVSQRFEDGTIPFSLIACLGAGFDVIDRIGMRSIERCAQPSS
jgi:selenocysteine lyase/cysteine desulfurase